MLTMMEGSMKQGGSKGEEALKERQEVAFIANRRLLRQLAEQMRAADDDGNVDQLRALCGILCREMGVEWID